MLGEKKEEMEKWFLEHPYVEMGLAAAGLTGLAALSGAISYSVVRAIKRYNHEGKFSLVDVIVKVTSFTGLALMLFGAIKDGKSLLSLAKEFLFVTDLITPKKASNECRTYWETGKCSKKDRGCEYVHERILSVVEGKKDETADTDEKSEKRMDMLSDLVGKVKDNKKTVAAIIAAALGLVVGVTIAYFDVPARIKHMINEGKDEDFPEDDPCGFEADYKKLVGGLGNEGNHRGKGRAQQRAAARDAKTGVGRITGGQNTTNLERDQNAGGGWGVGIEQAAVNRSDLDNIRQEAAEKKWTPAETYEAVNERLISKLKSEMDQDVIRGEMFQHDTDAQTSHNDHGKIMCPLCDFSRTWDSAEFYNAHKYAMNVHMVGRHKNEFGHLWRVLENPLLFKAFDRAREYGSPKVFRAVNIYITRQTITPGKESFHAKKMQEILDDQEVYDPDKKGRDQRAEELREEIKRERELEKKASEKGESMGERLARMRREREQRGDVVDEETKNKRSAPVHIEEEFKLGDRKKTRTEKESEEAAEKEVQDKRKDKAAKLEAARKALKALEKADEDDIYSEDRSISKNQKSRNEKNDFKYTDTKKSYKQQRNERRNNRKNEGRSLTPEARGRSAPPAKRNPDGYINLPQDEWKNLSRTKQLEIMDHNAELRAKAEKKKSEGKQTTQEKKIKEDKPTHSSGGIRSEPIVTDLEHQGKQFNQMIMIKQKKTCVLPVYRDANIVEPPSERDRMFNASYVMLKSTKRVNGESIVTVKQVLMTPKYDVTEYGAGFLWLRIKTETDVVKLTAFPVKWKFFEQFAYCEVNCAKSIPVGTDNRYEMKPFGLPNSRFSGHLFASVNGGEDLAVGSSPMAKIITQGVHEITHTIATSKGHCGSAVMMGNNIVGIHWKGSDTEPNRALAFDENVFQHIVGEDMA